MVSHRGRDAGGRAAAADRARPAHGRLEPRGARPGDSRGGVPRRRLRAPLGARGRSTTSTSTGSRRGPTCCGRSATRSPPPCASTSRRRSGWPARSSARWRSPPPASLASGLPFVIVRSKAKEYGTGEPDRGRVRARGARLPRRGRRHGRRSGARGGRGAARGGASGPTRRSASSTVRRAVTTRSRAGRAPASALHGFRAPRKRRKSAWLSDIRRPC